MPKRLLKLSACCFAVLRGGVALAGVIDFEDVAPYPANYPLTSIVSDGFQFTDTGMAAVVYNGQYCSPLCPVNGTNMLLTPYGIEGPTTSTSVVQMSMIGGGRFDLIGFDGTGSFNFNLAPNPDWVEYFPKQIDVVGTRATGERIRQSFVIDSSATDGPLPLQTYQASGQFTNLVSVAFSASGSSQQIYDGFSLDNIRVAAVPEPEIYAMLIAGLGVMGAIGRRREAN